MNPPRIKVYVETVDAGDDFNSSRMDLHLDRNDPC